MKYYDAVVIGGGVLGCFAARALTRYDINVALLEKREDLCTGISRANTAIIYSGCDTKPGTLKTSMCVKSSQGFASLCAELGVRYSRCGSIMICFGGRGEGILRKKLRDGIENGVRGIRLLTREEVLELEPGIAGNVRSGLYVPDTGTVMPWELCMAAASCAAKNGAEFFLDTEVADIGDGGAYRYRIQTDNGVFFARAVVNCAGMASDKLLEMISEPVVRIVPTAGDYYILDTKATGFINHVIFHEPEERGKGLTLVPTVDGNILIGPTERPVDPGFEPDGFPTASGGLELLRALAAEIVPELSLDHIIRSFGAIRPNPYFLHRDTSGGWTVDDKSVSDFCIVESGGGSFISLVGIKTPGLTCAAELGEHVAGKIAEMLGAAEVGNGKWKIKMENQGTEIRGVIPGS